MTHPSAVVKVLTAGAWGEELACGLHFRWSACHKQTVESQNENREGLHRAGFLSE